MGKAKDVSRAELQEVIDSFDFGGKLEEVSIFGNGHINETYCAVFSTENGKKRYILQKMNRQIFQDPVGLMENISGVTSWLKKKILENGGDPERETLHETIPNFHNTVKRFSDFKKAVEKDACGRAADVQKEIQFVLEREQLTHTLVDLQEAGKLPLRVTHNDTKLNNIMIDNATHKGICVIDLDTVMPGLSLNDFGDSIRFGASTAAEDEQDISKVFCDLHLFEVYVKGFLKGCGGALTDLEVEMLPMGAILMTFECGMRFLADHLEGDHYFRIHRENQNLDRARTQFKLVWDMEQKLSEMKAIVEKYK